MNEFDRVARYYDGLARLVFGKAIINSQLHFLSRIPKSGKVLVLGGGTGWWLNDVALQNKDLEIWFVEASKGMLIQAKKNAVMGLNIHFIHGNSMNQNHAPEFNTVITFFFLDVFRQQALEEEIQKIRGYMKPGALWMATDFVNENWWHAFMLGIMYRFFGLVANLTAQSLPDWHGELLRSGLNEIETSYYYRGFIKSSLFTL